MFNLENSTDLQTWSLFQSIQGRGQTSSITAPMEAKGFFRLSEQFFPLLSSVSLASGARDLTPPFSPHVYRYYFRQETNVALVRFTFDGSVQEARLNGAPIASGADVSAPQSGERKLTLELTGTNQLRTVYHFESMPLSFPKMQITHFNAPDSNSVRLLGVKGASSKGAGPSTFVAAVDHHGVPYWWKDIELGHNLKLHDNGLVGYTRLVGTNSAGERIGEHFVLDDYFHDLFSLKPAGDVIPDIHDIFMTKRGTFYTLGYTRTNRTALINGVLTNIALKDNLIQEVSTLTRELLFEWNAWDHFNYDNMKYPQKDDYAHLNWVREDRDGNLIVSARAQSQVVKVNRQTGAVMWRLGREGDMTVENDPLGGVAGQHAAHTLPNGNLLVFDNRNFGTTNVIQASDGPSRVVEYRIDENAKKATLVWSYSREGHHTTSNGGVQRLANGNTLVSWGLTPPTFATEVNPQGEIVEDIRILDDENRPLLGYIAYKWPITKFPAIQEMIAGPQYPR